MRAGLTSPPLGSFFLASFKKLSVVVTAFGADELSLFHRFAALWFSAMDMRAHGLPQRMQRFYERVSSERERALVELPELFTNDIHFMNPVVDEMGMDKFYAQWMRAFSMYKTFHFEGFYVTGDDQRFIMSYTMMNGFVIGPVFTIKLTTECWARDGKICKMRDEFDVMGTFLQPFPLLTWMYRSACRILIA